MFQRFKRFAFSDTGATAIEYSLIAALIAVALIVILGDLGGRIGGVFTEVSDAIK